MNLLEHSCVDKNYFYYTPNHKIPYKLRHFVQENIDKLDWNHLSENINAICTLEKIVDKIVWQYLSSNPYAIHILEKNQSKINWIRLSSNPNAIHILDCPESNLPILTRSKAVNFT